MDPVRRIGGPRAGVLGLLAAALLLVLIVLAQRGRRAEVAATPSERAATSEAAPVVLAAAGVPVATPERVALETATANPAATDTRTAAMRGTLLVDGRPPEWPVLLEFTSALGDSRVVRGGVVPDEGGAFDFGEFPAYWSGHVEAEESTFEDGAKRLALDAPRTDLVLRLRSPPALTGRVVDPRTHAPVSDASVRAWLKAKVEPVSPPTAELESAFVFDAYTEEPAGTEQEQVTTRRGSSNANGRFRIALHGRGERTGSLLFESAGRWRRAFTLPPFQSEHGLELGDIELEPAFEQRFRLLDADDRPIADGQAQDTALGELVARTDAAGRGVLDCVPPEGLEIRFSAPSHHDETRTVVPGEPLDIHLRRATMLELRLVSPQGGFGSVSARLSATEPLFAWEVRSDWHRLYANGKDARRERVLTFKDDGVLREDNLLPAVPFQIQIFYDQQILATRSAELVEGEWLTLEIPITLPARPALVPFPLNR